MSQGILSLVAQEGVVVLERPALPGDEWFVCNLLTCERTQLQGPSSGEWSLGFDAAEPYAAFLSDESGESLWVPELQLLSVYVDDEGKRFVRNIRTGKVTAWEEHVAWNVEVAFKIRIGATMTELDKEWRAAVFQCQHGCRVWWSLTDLLLAGEIRAEGPRRPLGVRHDPELVALLGHEPPFGRRTFSAEQLALRRVGPRAHPAVHVGVDDCADRAANQAP